MTFNFTMNEKEKEDSSNIMYSKIGEDFCKLYYHKMAESGFSNVMNLFTKDSRCTYDNQEFLGCYDLLIKLSQLGIHKFNYKKINANYQPFGDSILISVFGEFNPISFQKQNGKLFKFSETFILKNINGNYFITNHILKIIK